MYYKITEEDKKELLSLLKANNDSMDRSLLETNPKALEGSLDGVPATGVAPPSPIVAYTGSYDELSPISEMWEALRHKNRSEASRRGARKFWAGKRRKNHRTRMQRREYRKLSEYKFWGWMVFNFHSVPGIDVEFVRAIGERCLELLRANGIPEANWINLKVRKADRNRSLKDKDNIIIYYYNKYNKKKYNYLYINLKDNLSYLREDKRYKRYLTSFPLLTTNKDYYNLYYKSKDTKRYKLKEKISYSMIENNIIII